MFKCLRISFESEAEGYIAIAHLIQQHAKKFDLEGVVQLIGPEKKVSVIACGLKDNLDAFLDVVYKEFEERPLKDVEVEPFLKDKDYRGVFRIIE
jgi:acylphosphatase